MSTRFGKNVLQDLADLSGREVPELSMRRLQARYAPAVAERKALEAANEKEFNLNIPHVARVRDKIAERLEAEASEINGKLPVASVFEAYRCVNEHKDRQTDAGLRALHGHLERMWKKSRTASITANLYLTLHDHYARNYPKSAAAGVLVEIGQNGYATLPLSDLTRIAASIETQKDFDREILYHGLNGPLPHQVKARRFILALLNAEEKDEGHYLDGMDTSLPFLGEEGDETSDSFTPPRSTPGDGVKTRGPKASHTPDWREALRRSASWMDNTGKKVVVDYDVHDENAPVTLVGVYSDAAPWEPTYLMLTQSGVDHALEKTLTEWQNKQTEQLDEGVMQEIIEELGPEASEDEVYEQYFYAMTENWDYFAEEYSSVTELVQELEASDNPDAQDVLGWLGL